MLGTVIPACVAFCLTSYGKIKSRREVHRLLNKHVLREIWKSLPQEGYSSSYTNQLWRDVEKVGSRLLAASYPLYFSGPEWMISHNRFSPQNLF